MRCRKQFAKPESRAKDESAAKRPYILPSPLHNGTRPSTIAMERGQISCGKLIPTYMALPAIRRANLHVSS